MAVQDNWFTQGDAYRSAWEDCGRSGGPNWPYTCGKLYDFEALIAHEFGHAHGLMHPTLIDSTASSLANCGSTTSRATICAATKSSLTHRSSASVESRAANPFSPHTPRPSASFRALRGSSYGNAS